MLTPINLVKDSYMNGRNTPTLIFEKLKPVEKFKKSFESLRVHLKSHCPICPVPAEIFFFDFSTGFRFSKIRVECSIHICSLSLVKSVN